ncbi:hypothetical protein MNBD_NITROSPINAE01-745, partial [hydrothermal vent metagenome]
MELTLALLAVINISFILFLLLKEWGTSTPRIRKFVSLFTLGVFPIFWGLGVVTHDLKQVQKVSFCGKCHVMTDYVNSLDVDDTEPLSAVHYQNNWVPREKACYACHTHYTMFGSTNAKLRGLTHLYVYYIKGAPKKIELYEKYENRECLRCHGPARKFAETKAHNLENNMLAQIRAGTLSCLSDGCHDVGHSLPSE